ncbi:MAG: M23 family metallopeptidase, partial [Stellaceae bacterium]
GAASETPVLANPLPAPAAPPGESAAARPTQTPEPAPAAVAPTGRVPEAPEAPKSVKPPVRGTSAFLWPVRGQVVSSYGAKADGTHNDGINIAAAKGTAVEAADEGVVAYTGNELRGYGNLILVKHGNGWISAYAHCDQILVKRGEKVARGQMIARVGATGNVSQPQLHFELRRGQHAVDPREFLAPLPTAGTDKPSSGG